MTESKLPTYVRKTKHYSTRRGDIRYIIPHCYVGQVTAKQGCDFFAATTRDVSANYVIGRDGSIGLSVPEQYRAREHVILNHTKEGFYGNTERTGGDFRFGKGI